MMMTSVIPAGIALALTALGERRLIYSATGSWLRHRKDLHPRPGR